MSNQIPRTHKEDITSPNESPTFQPTTERSYLEAVARQPNKGSENCEPKTSVGIWTSKRKDVYIEIWLIYEKIERKSSSFVTEGEVDRCRGYLAFVN